MVQKAAGTGLLDNRSFLLNDNSNSTRKFEATPEQGATIERSPIKNEMQF